MTVKIPVSSLSGINFAKVKILSGCVSTNLLGRQPYHRPMKFIRQNFNSENQSDYEKISSPGQFEGFAGMIKGGKKCVKSFLGGHHLLT